MCRLLFAVLICAGISKTYAGSPYVYDQHDYDRRNPGTNYQESFKREQVNPWAIRPQVRRNYYNPRQQHYPDPSPPVPSGPRFISEEELDALNNDGYYPGVIDTPDNSATVPLYDQKRKPSAYETSPYARKDFNQPALPREEFDQYRNKMPESRKQTTTRPSMYPLDPIDPGQFGVPFAAPFDSIDTFIYE